jgi:hypothetical protein
VQSVSLSPFRGKELPPLSELKSKPSKEQANLCLLLVHTLTKHGYISVRLRGFISQETVVLTGTAARTLNITRDFWVVKPCSRVDLFIYLFLVLESWSVFPSSIVLFAVCTISINGILAITKEFFYSLKSRRVSIISSWALRFQRSNFQEYKVMSTGPTTFHKESWNIQGDVLWVGCCKHNKARRLASE